MGFEEFKKEAKKSLKKVAMAGVAAGSFLPGMAAENGEKSEDASLEAGTYANMEKKSQDPLLENENIDFLSAEMEMKQKEYESLIEARQEVEKELDQAKQNLSAHQNDFMIALQKAKFYIAQQDGRDYKQAQKELEKFDAQGFLDGINAKIQGFVESYAAQGVSHEDMKGQEILIGIITHAVEIGDENAKHLTDALEDHYVTQNQRGNDEGERDILQNPAKTMSEDIITISEKQALADQIDEKIQDITNGETSFASK